jgi:hypothetical protein
MGGRFVASRNYQIPTTYEAKWAFQLRWGANVVGFWKLCHKTNLGESIAFYKEMPISLHSDARIKKIASHSEKKILLEKPPNSSVQNKHI